MSPPKIKYEAETKEEFSQLEEAAKRLFEACDIRVESDWTPKGVVVSGHANAPIITPIEHSSIASVIAKNDNLKLLQYTTDHSMKVKLGETQYTINYHPK